MSTLYWRPGLEMILRVQSFGAGLQSTCMLFMQLLGEIERCDCAIFADTQDESAATYAHLDYCTRYAAERGFKIHRVTIGKLSEKMMGNWRKDANTSFVTIPTFGDRGGINRRQCTREFKVAPITKKVRELLGVAPRKRIKGIAAESWQGISIDEAHRMKTNREPWIRNVYPLVDLRMTRHDCANWLKRHGFPIPSKSACIFCPYHDAATWRRMKLESPDEWQRVVELDRKLRVRGEYLHRSLKPLDEVDFSTAEDHGQLNMQFGNECEGMCGV